MVGILAVLLGGQEGDTVPTHVPEGTNKCFCTFCGTQLIVDDGSRTVTFRTVDEARIREAEIEKELELKQLEIEEARRPFRLKLMAVLAIIGLIMLVGGTFLSRMDGDPLSPWGTVALLGFFPLLAVPFVWMGTWPLRR